MWYEWKIWEITTEKNFRSSSFFISSNIKQALLTFSTHFGIFSVCCNREAKQMYLFFFMSYFWFTRNYLMIEDCCSPLIIKSVMCSVNLLLLTYCNFFLSLSQIVVSVPTAWNKIRICWANETESKHTSVLVLTRGRKPQSVSKITTKQIATKQLLHWGPL